MSAPAQAAPALTPEQQQAETRKEWARTAKNGTAPPPSEPPSAVVDVPAPDAAEPPSDAETRANGELRMAYRFARTYQGRVLRDADLKAWRIWDGRRWVKDTVEDTTVRALLRDCRNEAWPEARDDRDLLKALLVCDSDRGTKGVLSQASACPEFAATSDSFDRDPHLLNTPAGTIDLDARERRPHRPGDRITKITRGSWRPGAHKGSRWEKFLTRVLPDEKVRRYFQVFVGVALHGRVLEQAFTIATGTGANGKSVAYEAILNALGDYAHTTDAALFMRAKRNADAPSPALYSLRGKRFVAVSETERDAPLAAAIVKSLTGGDQITARPLYGDPVTFEATHTPLMITNHLPRVDGTDPALWRRLRVIPFDVVVPEEERDPRLGEKLATQEEADAIISWAMEGWEYYREHGRMPEAEAVTSATEDYKRESDTVARFVDERCVRHRTAWVSLADAYAAYQEWAQDNGEEPLSKRRFSAQLEGTGCKKVRRRAGFGLLGLGLAAEEPAPEPGPAAEEPTAPPPRLDVDDAPEPYEPPVADAPPASADAPEPAEPHPGARAHAPAPAPRRPTAPPGRDPRTEPTRPRPLTRDPAPADQRRSGRRRE